MNLNQIQSFLAITKTLNFTAAARQLGIPQSTISRQINDLESKLNVRLFHRTKRDVALTDEGRTFLPFAKEIADAADKGTRAVRKLHDGGAGHLSIAVVPAAENFLCRCLDRFHRDYPDIVVDIERIPAGYSLVDDLESTEDFYFIYGDMMSAGEDYESMTTHREPIVLVAHPSAGNDLSPEHLADSDMIMVSEEADPILFMQAVNYCRTHRFSPKIVNSLKDISSLMISLKSGMGVSFLPASLVEGYSEDELTLHPLDDENYSITCVAAWKSSLLNPAAALFLETIIGLTA